MMQTKIRRYEFDWLRVLAFTLLVFFHTGMLFVSWEWHIKNNEISDGIEWPMIFLSQWRMPLIFLISGVGVYYALDFRSPRVFLQDRFRRILLPLLAGIFLVVAPQVYFERMAQGAEDHYFSFFMTFLEFEPYPDGNFSWHHLWFLTYILVYSVLLLPLLFVIKRRTFRFERTRGWMLLLLPGLWLGMGESLLKPLFPISGAFYNDWAAHYLYVSIFIFGFLIVSSARLQEKIRQTCRYSLALALIAVVLLYGLFWFSSTGWEYLGSTTYYYLVSINRWCWMMAILGFSLRYLKANTPYLRMLNELVYPFYILHQTVIVVLGYYIRDLSWPILTKFCFVAIFTFVSCFVLIRFVIMKVNFLRIPFGMKALKKER
ncbi:acyltransferase family protein [Sinomicrobium soli]|uniref:acyltransferase family protein n=1 Tax=Sinomicrobium sp. N-1-3-6 TaxID=2219864 RepID=UPI000DCE1B0E|nr:acyltransferase family protein [Sinomicrobium sp. N-1-3-6]RAV30336.1 acyltransferase [Sinomicrobium sp. N-1-3-6]